MSDFLLALLVASWATSLIRHPAAASGFPWPPVGASRVGCCLPRLKAASTPAGTLSPLPDRVSLPTVLRRRRRRRVRRGRRAGARNTATARFEVFRQADLCLGGTETVARCSIGRSARSLKSAWAGTEHRLGLGQQAALASSTSLAALAHGVLQCSGWRDQLRPPVRLARGDRHGHLRSVLHCGEPGAGTAMRDTMNSAAPSRTAA